VKRNVEVAKIRMRREWFAEGGIHLLRPLNLLDCPCGLPLVYEAAVLFVDVWKVALRSLAAKSKSLNLVIWHKAANCSKATVFQK
jgi:hypothetical protein